MSTANTGCRLRALIAAVDGRRALGPELPRCLLIETLGLKQRLFFGLWSTNFRTLENFGPTQSTNFSKIRTLESELFRLSRLIFYI